MKLELVTIINLLRHFFNSCCTRLKPKIIYYRNYKNLNEELFLKDLEPFGKNSDNPPKNYTNLSQTFSKVLEKHAPLKKKVLRKN